MSYSAIEIGLPFFDDINKQCRNKPFFTAYLTEWISIQDRFPAFQFKVGLADATITDFDLINVDTGATVDYLTFFLANATTYSGTTMKWWLYDGSTALAVTPDVGRYYLYVKSTDGVEKYSEVFTVTTETFTTYVPPGFINIGLPFFDRIGKQLSKQPYFNSYSANWLTANNRFPNFQLNAGDPSGFTVFNLVNSVTGATTDFLAHFNANMIETLRDGSYYYTYMGLVDVSVDNGRYYFFATTNGSGSYYSEEFTMCENIEPTSDYLLLDSTDILLLDATDKLKIG